MGVNKTHDLLNFLDGISVDSSELNTLLASGICNYKSNTDLDNYNKLLRPIGYEAIIWFDKSAVVLKESLEPSEFQVLWSEKKILEAKAVFSKIAAGRNHINDHIAIELEEKNWIKKTGNSTYYFTKRALIQFEDFILNTEHSVFNKCGLCNLLVEKEKYHQYCQNLLNKNQKLLYIVIYNYIVSK